MSRYIPDKTLKIADWITAEQQKRIEARLEANQPSRFPMGGGGVRQWNRMMAFRSIPKRARKPKPAPESGKLTPKDLNDLIRRSRPGSQNRPRRIRELTP